MAVYANLIVDQGSDFRSTITVEDTNSNIVDLGPYTARGQVRRTYTSSTAYDFIVSIPNPTVGELIIALTSATTGSMKPGRYVYDVEIVASDGTITRVVEGQMEVTPRVTR